MVIEISDYVVLTGFCWPVEILTNYFHLKQFSLSFCCEEKVLRVPLSVEFPFGMEAALLVKLDSYSFKEHKKEIYAFPRYCM